jgi:hypothetical protein
MRSCCCSVLLLTLPVVFLAGIQTARSDESKLAGNAGPLVRTLWLVQRHGTAEAVKPENDQRTKGKISKALGKDAVLTTDKVKGLIDPETFAKLAGPDGRLDMQEVQHIMESEAPESRSRLLLKVCSWAKYQTTTFDQIDVPHREAGEKLADWIVKNYKPGQPLDIICVCTGNSRRSIFGATCGNIAAAYYGMPEVRFHSGGTKPSAVNHRAITALKEIGVEVEPTGQEAPRGEPQTANPIVVVRWGLAGETGAPKVETIEFSKTYADPSNPQDGFAALMLCGEADANCPVVNGASIRISMPYLDPKIYDDSEYEASKYAERRDDVGRLMLSVMMQVRNRLATR